MPTVCECTGQFVENDLDKRSVYDESYHEANCFKWYESEKAGRDLGNDAIRNWIRRHWWGFLRARWIQHLQGSQFWIELDRGDFGLLQRRFTSHTILLDRIIDRLKEGAENLDIICWAKNWNIPLEPVMEILEVLDINGHRLCHRFDVE